MLTPFSTPPLQDGVPHAVVVLALTQDLVSTPLQRRPHLGSVRVALQAAWPGNGCPTIGMHLPTEPTWLQASQEPSHLLSQQTPSTQAPLAQSVETAQAVPFKLWQMPLVVPAEQDLPAPQEATAQHTPSVQKPLVHVEEVVQVVPSPSIGTHAPVLQYDPVAQSVLVVQLDLQLLAAHAK